MKKSTAAKRPKGLGKVKKVNLKPVYGGLELYRLQNGDMIEYGDWCAPVCSKQPTFVIMGGVIITSLHHPHYRILPLGSSARPKAGPKQHTKD